MSERYNFKKKNGILGLLWNEYKDIIVKIFMFITAILVLTPINYHFGMFEEFGHNIWENFLSSCVICVLYLAEIAIIFLICAFALVILTFLYSKMSSALRVLYAYKRFAYIPLTKEERDKYGITFARYIELLNDYQTNFPKILTYGEVGCRVYFPNKLEIQILGDILTSFPVEERKSIDTNMKTMFGELFYFNMEDVRRYLG